MEVICVHCGCEIRDGQKRIHEEKIGTSHMYLSACVTALRERIESLEEERRDQNELED